MNKLFGNLDPSEQEKKWIIYVVNHAFKKDGPVEIQAEVLLLATTAGTHHQADKKRIMQPTLH